MERKAADTHTMTNWHLDEALRSSDLKRTQTEEHFVRAGVCERGGKAAYCHCDDPDILEQPRGASLFARSSVGFEKT